MSFFQNMHSLWKTLRTTRRASPARGRRTLVPMEPLEVRTLLAAAFPEFVDPNPSPGNQFGYWVVPLSTGNVVVTSPFADVNGTDAGAVYLFNGKTGALISTLSGGSAGDQLGIRQITTLPSGNFLVYNPSWDNGLVADAGAVTWGSGTTGIEGAVSVSNSLVGLTASDRVGETNAMVLSNGNYVVRSRLWDNGAAADAGAVTWGSGTTGITGAVSVSNSLVGTSYNDRLGEDGVTALSNGNYVVNSSLWDNGAAADAGAVTWGSGTTGITGTVSASNSLVGTATLDRVGYYGITALSSGNYVVSSPYWRNGLVAEAGAVTWGNGTTGITGTVSASNSLVGTATLDRVGYYGITALSSGNYVVSSPYWRNGLVAEAGAVTWGNGTTGITGAVSASNSLVGTSTSDFVGKDGVTVLSNGNYVVRSRLWDNGAAADAGAVTWGSGTTGITGAVSVSNSLVGTSYNDRVGSNGVWVLSNGNYVALSPNWDNVGVVDAGAATWGSGTAGIKGAVSASNSLVGTSTSDFVGSYIAWMSNGNYMIRSPDWDNIGVTNAGAVTWANGTTGITGAVSDSNSLVGSTVDDRVGYYDTIFLSNGNYLIRNPDWDNGMAVNAGAVTWGSGTTGITGAVSVSNSLVGTSYNDRVGSNGVWVLSNGNYVVQSSFWDNGGMTDAGAVTFGRAIGGVVGTISPTNSAVGMAANTNLSSVVVDNINNTFYGRFRAEGGGRVRVGSQTAGFANDPPIISSLQANLAVNDNATVSPFAAITLTDPDNQNMFARVTIFNGVFRGDFTPATVTGWTRTVSGNDIKYERFYSRQANIGSVVQAAVRAFVFQPRTNAIKPNTTELTDISLFVNDGLSNATATTRITTTSVNNAPTFGGTSANVAVNDNATVTPFAALTVSDVDTQEFLFSVTILNGRVRGDFTNATPANGWTVRFTTGNNITYKRYFSPQANVGAAAQAAFRALVFQPRQNAITPGTTESTDFQVTVSDGVAPAIANQDTRVTTTSVNNAPTLGGVVANQTINDNQTKAVFSALTVTDPDTQGILARVTINNGIARGDFTTASAAGWARLVVGNNFQYSRYFDPVTNTGSVVQTAIRALVFQPRTDVPIGTTETTTFTVFVNDGIANVTNSETSVITTGVAPRPAPVTVSPPVILEQDVTTVVLPSVNKPRTNPLARLLKKSR